ncbi:unnamed protein product [Coregonus sp. 'balchen']|nr:unnamed protein product [Coregonus sp. 'balchen']
MEALEVLGGYPTKSSNPRTRMSRKPQDFYSFEMKDAKGRSVSLERYRSKVTTEKNYHSLRELHRELGTSHFNALAFPCGQFGKTEMGASRDIEAYAKNTYDVTFPIFSKI